MPDDERKADDGRVKGWANAEESGSDEEDEDYMGETDDESELEVGVPILRIVAVVTWMTMNVV